MHTHIRMHIAHIHAISYTRTPYCTSHAHAHHDARTLHIPAVGADREGASDMVGPMVMVGGAVRVGLTVGGWVRVGLIVGGREGEPLGPIVLGAGDVGLGMIDKKGGGSSG